MNIFKVCAAMAVVLSLAACIERPYVAVEPLPPEISQQSRELPVTWAYFGDIKTMLDYYPAKAWYAHEDGTVDATCDWDAAGRIIGCTVLHEAPEGFGFGESTAAMLKKVGRVKAKDPSKPIQAGEGLLITIHWQKR